MVCGPLRVLGAAVQEAGGTEGRDEAVPLAPVPALGIIYLLFNFLLHGQKNICCTVLIPDGGISNFIEKATPGSAPLIVSVPNILTRWQKPGSGACAGS